MNFVNCREIDPRYLYDNDGGRKKSRTSQASYDNIQLVSIHKINLNHDKLSRKSVDDAIDFIIDAYNKAKEGSEGDTKNIYKRMTVERKPVLKPEDRKHFKGDEFRVKVYVQKVAKNISLLRAYGVKEKATTIHSLIFHYRANELFAITTNQSWNVVQWCSDFEFPNKIAARILRGGEWESTEKGLVGTESTRKTTHKQEKKTNPYDLLTFCTRFTAELRKDASILRLSCFQEKPSFVGNDEGNDGEDGKQAERQCRKIKGVKMVVSTGNIRILKRFSTSDLLSILSVLSEISNQRETVNLRGKEERNSSAHKKLLTPVICTELSKELNICLSEIIHDAIADNNRMAELDNFQFSHKHSTDLFNAYTFELHYKDRSIKEFSEIPTLKQIVVALRMDLGQIEEETSRETFLRLLSYAKISYRFGNNVEKKREKFLNFIDGPMCHSKDNSVYWHVNANWCHVQDGYVNVVQDQFKKILTNYLLTDENDPAFLQIRWPKNGNSISESKYGIYLQKFANYEDVWITENPERGIVDMIKIGRGEAGENVFFVYYFLPDLNNKTNMKCHRVAESIMQIGKVRMAHAQSRSLDLGGSEDVRELLQAVYKKVVRKRRFAEICMNVDKFLQMVTSAKFYLAIGREVDTSRSIDVVPSLLNEKEMPTKVTIENIADILENLIEHDFQMLKRTATTLKQPFDKSRCTQLAESIHQQLRQHKYIEVEDNSVRGELMRVSRNNFTITGNDTVNKFLYEKIVSKFQPGACTVLSKLAFIEMGEAISKLTISFNLMEIPLEE